MAPQTTKTCTLTPQTTKTFEKCHFSLNMPIIPLPRVISIKKTRIIQKKIQKNSKINKLKFYFLFLISYFFKKIWVFEVALFATPSLSIL
jgi:hypothetical protein